MNNIQRIILKKKFKYIDVPINTEKKSKKKINISPMLNSIILSEKKQKIKYKFIITLIVLLACIISYN